MLESGPSVAHTWSSHTSAFISFTCCKYLVNKVPGSQVSAWVVAAAPQQQQVVEARGTHWCSHMSAVRVAVSALTAIRSARSANTVSPWMANSVLYLVNAEHDADASEQAAEGHGRLVSTRARNSLSTDAREHALHHVAQLRSSRRHVACQVLVRPKHACELGRRGEGWR